MTYDSGIARAAYLLDISQPRQAAQELRALFQGIQTTASGAGAGGARSGAIASQTSSITQLQRAQAGLELQQARLARTQGDVARAADLESQAQRRLISTLSQQNTTTTQTIGIQRQLVSSQQQIERANQRGVGLAQEFGQGIKSGLLNIVGPAALAAGALTALSGTVDSFKKAFLFKADLDAQTRSIRTNLEGVRDQGAVFREAQQFAERYRLTQKETTDILASSTDILRVSTSSVGNLESALLRLQSRDVAKPISEAARALRELNSGDVTSIKDLFNVPAKEALRMRDEIVAGGDAVQVLNSYLDRAGVGMAVLENRSKGAAGALNEQAIAAEKLQLAQAKFAEGPGVAFTGFKTNIINEITALLSGDFSQIEARNAARIKGQEAYNAAIQQGKTDAEALAIAQQVMADAERSAAVAAAAASGAHSRLKDDIVAVADATTISVDALSKDSIAKLDSEIKTAELAAQQQQLASDSRAAAVGLLGAGDQALILAQKYGIATDQAQFLIRQQQALSNATALADQRKGEQTGTDLTAKQFDTFSKLRRGREQEDAADAKRAADTAKAEAAQIRSAQDALNLTRARTKEQRIAELQRQQAATTDQAEKLRLQAQIEQEKRSGAGRVGAAQSTAQQLNTVEQNSGLQLLKTQRENLERLRDQAEDFDVRRSRSQEDFAEKRRGLLARGQRAQAAELTRDFARDQRREQEDFDRQRRRTLRNNAEGVGDIGARADLRGSQIADRAALRGVRPSGAIPSGLQPLPSGALAPLGAPRAPQTVALLTIQGVINLDSKAVGNGIWPTIEVLMDESLAVSLAAIGAPLSGQPAVAGSPP